MRWTNGGTFFSPCGLYIVVDGENTNMSSCCFNGAFFAFRNPVQPFFFHTSEYFSQSILEQPRIAVNGICDVRTIAPCGLIILLYSSHNGSKGI